MKIKEVKRARIMMCRTGWVLAYGKRRKTGAWGKRCLKGGGRALVKSGELKVEELLK